MGYAKNRAFDYMDSPNCKSTVSNYPLIYSSRLSYVVES